MSDGDDLEAVVASASPDRYVAALFAPRDLRPSLMALYAFDHEVARIAQVAHEPMVGHIRLAWWREQIAAIYAGDAVHAPVVRALADTVRRHTLPRNFFEQYIDARARDFEETPFDDEAAMAQHALAVAAGILRLAARVLGAEERADVAAGYAGLAVACAGHIATLGEDARYRRCRLPRQWLREADIGAEDVFVGRATPALRIVARRLSDAGRNALKALNSERFPVRATPALATAAALRPILKRAASSGDFDPFAPAPALPAWQRVARIAFANLTWWI